MDLTPEELEFLASVFDAVRDGATDAVARVLDQGLPANLTNDQGDTLLILAAYHDHPALVELLLAHGAEPDRVNDRGQTALGAATFRQNERSVRSLLAAGADPRPSADVVCSRPAPSPPVPSRWVRRPTPRRPPRHRGSGRAPRRASRPRPRAPAPWPRSPRRTTRWSPAETS